MGERRKVTLVATAFSTGVKTFNGTLTCASGSGNRVMVVAYDATRNLWDRTIVEDNGASGDKLLNTMFSAVHHPHTRLKNCTDPTNVTMSAATLSGDPITVFNPTDGL